MSRSAASRYHRERTDALPAAALRATAVPDRTFAHRVDAGPLR